MSVYSINLTKRLAIDPRVSVCECVCMCVCACVCVISTAQTDRLILIKLSTNHLLHISFSPILKIHIWWRHGGHYSYFRFGHSSGRNFPLIFWKKLVGRVSKTPFRVCYWNSEKSVDNFGSDGLPRFRKRDKMAAKNIYFLISFKLDK